MTRRSDTDIVRLAYRAVVLGVLVARLLVLHYYARLALTQMILPVDDQFFPALFTEPRLLLSAVAVPILLEMLVLARPTTLNLRVVASFELASSGVLLLHQAAYFSATWVVSFWAAAFLCWLAWSGQRDASHARRAGPFMAQLLIAFLFLGGAVGKWTAGYWSGDVFDQLLFTRPGFPYELMRGYLDDTGRHMLAVALSRAVVLVESTAIFIPFLAATPAALLGIGAALGITVMGAPEIGVIMIGLCSSGWLLRARHTPVTVGYDSAHRPWRLAQAR